jgi:hypothetical protein
VTLTTHTALATLNQMLRDGGFDHAKPDLAIFWAVYQRFITLPVEGIDPSTDNDLLLFQGGRETMIDFTRQFSHDDAAGEYVGMEQLYCSFYYDDDAFEDRVPEIWGGTVDRSDAWVARVEAEPTFQAGLRHEPREVRIDQGDV